MKEEIGKTRQSRVLDLKPEAQRQGCTRKVEGKASTTPLLRDLPLFIAPHDAHPTTPNHDPSQSDHVDYTTRRQSIPYILTPVGAVVEESHIAYSHSRRHRCRS